MVLTMFRRILLTGALIAALSTGARADPITIAFTAQIGSSNNVDSQNIFGEGFRADLASQIITGSVSIDPVALTQKCSSGGACYGDFGAGSITVSSFGGFTSPPGRNVEASTRSARALPSLVAK